MPAEIIRLPSVQTCPTALRADFLAGLTPATATVYGRHLDRLLAYCGNRSVADITRSDLESWCRSLRESGRADKTILLALAAVRSFLTFALYEGVVDRNVAKAVRLNVTKVESPRRPLSPDQVRRIFAVCEDDLRGLRDRAMLTLMAVQALRVSEVAAVRVEDLGQEGSHLTLDVRGKGNKHSTVPQAPQTHDALRAWMRAAGIESGAVMVGIDRARRVQFNQPMSIQALHKRVVVLGRRAGINRPVHPHLFRHSAVTTFLESGGSLRHASSLARHSNIATTMVYDGHRRSLNNPAVHVLASAFIPAEEAAQEA